jgi:putative ABC transport system permease protein
VLAGKGQGGMGMDQDDLIVVPLATAQRRITGNTRVNTLLVSLQPGSDADARQEEPGRSCCASGASSADADDDNFNVLDTQQIADTLSGTTQVLTSCWARWPPSACWSAASAS